MAKRFFIVTCKKCGKQFEVLEEEKTFPKKEKYFCSRSCANSRCLTDEIKQKIGISVKNYHKKNNQNKHKQIKKYICGTEELNEKYPEISKHKITKWFKNLVPFGFNIESIWTVNIVDEYFKCKELLFKEYFINKLSPADIYKKYNCNLYIQHSETILHILKEFGFKTRTISNSVINAFLQGKCFNTNKNQYKSGWHTTWDNKEVYLRSSYEFNYAIYLDDNKILYDVESKRIKYYDSQQNEFRCAIPDFYLEETNTIVEIKSLWTYDHINMKDKVKAYKNANYNFKLILDGVEYTNLDDIIN